MAGSAVLPAKASTATGRPRRRSSRPNTTCGPVGPVVAAVAVRRERAAAALQPGRGDVEQDEAARRRGGAARGPARRPAGAPAASRARRTARPRSAPSTPSSAARVVAARPRAVASFEAGARMRATMSATARSRIRDGAPVEEPLEARGARSIAEDRRHVAVGQAAQDAQAATGRRHERLAPERPLQGVDRGRRQGGQRGQRAVLDLAALAVRLAQQHRLVLAGPRARDRTLATCIAPVARLDMRSSSHTGSQMSTSILATESSRHETQTIGSVRGAAAIRPGWVWKFGLMTGFGRTVNHHRLPPSRPRGAIERAPRRTARWADRPRARAS